MPTNYPGNPAAGAEGASPAPDPENAPIVTMPVSGDAVVVAGVQQAWKTLADHVAFLKLPRAIASSWTQSVKRFLNAKLHTVSGADHLGFPGGDFTQLNQNWVDVAGDKTSSPSSGTWFGPWSYGLFGGAGPFVKLDGAGASLSAAPWGALLQLATNSGIPAAALVEMVKPWLQISEASLTMTCSFSVNGASAPDAQTTYAFGFSDGTLLGGASTTQFSGIIPVGAGIMRSGSSNWLWWYKPPGGGGAVTGSTGIALARDTPHKFRMDVLGTTGADDSTARIIYYIDDAIVSNQTVDMTGAFVCPFFRVSNAVNADVTALNIGPLRVRARLALADSGL